MNKRTEIPAAELHATGENTNHSSISETAEQKEIVIHPFALTLYDANRNGKPSFKNSYGNVQDMLNQSLSPKHKKELARGLKRIQDNVYEKEWVIDNATITIHFVTDDPAVVSGKETPFDVAHLWVTQRWTGSAIYIKLTQATPEKLIQSGNYTIHKISNKPKNMTYKVTIRSKDGTFSHTYSLPAAQIKKLQSIAADMESQPTSEELTSAKKAQTASLFKPGDIIDLSQFGRKRKTRRPQAPRNNATPSRPERKPKDLNQIRLASSFNDKQYSFPRDGAQPFPVSWEVESHEGKDYYIGHRQELEPNDESPLEFLERAGISVPDILKDKLSSIKSPSKGGPTELNLVLDKKYRINRSEGEADLVVLKGNFTYYEKTKLIDIYLVPIHPGKANFEQDTLLSLSFDDIGLPSLNIKAEHHDDEYAVDFNITNADLITYRGLSKVIPHLDTTAPGVERVLNALAMKHYINTIKFDFQDNVLTLTSKDRALTLDTTSSEDHKLLHFIFVGSNRYVDVLNLIGN